ncbi:CBS domain-containing protein [Solihabitans fulvus]|uniref:CBS domain-containing protein n=1 Tax=Solihabitans fulvus TaxID=1892852 RepID=A0A5B2XQB2_9PSEU|nr:CBS domain-containing protein [Solihabitans fulvus]KAA2265927.1 CBS domain-containing protein [Solihabitans fulvus]
MHEPTAADVMTRQVITAVPDTPFLVLAGLLAAHGIGALPVLDPTGRPIGVVEDIDVLAKLEFHAGADGPPLLAGARCRARWRKSSGLTAADLMSRRMLAVTEGTSLAVVVRVLAGERLRQLFVVDGGGRLVGVLARRDVLRLYLRGDRAIQTDIDRTLAGLAAYPFTISAYVADGVVALEGRLPLRSTAERAIRLASHVSGVIAVRDNLRYDVDDLMITGL